MAAKLCRVLAVGVILGALVLAGCGTQGGGGSGAPQTLVVGFLPLENPQRLTPDADRFAEYLSARLDRPVEAFVPTEYAPLVEGLRAKRVHIAFMGSLATVMAHELAGARPILGEVQRGETFYRSQFYVRADSGMASLEDLAGRSVAFTSPTGGSGFVFPVSMLVDRGLLGPGEDPGRFFGEVVFAGGDEQVLTAVLRGHVDAGATSDYAPGLVLTPEERARLTVIGGTEVPPHSVVVSGELSDDLVEEIRAALMGMSAPEGIETLRAIYGADGFVPVAIEEYQVVVDAARNAGLDLEDLLAP